MLNTSNAGARNNKIVLKFCDWMDEVALESRAIRVSIDIFTNIASLSFK